MRVQVMGCGILHRFVALLAAWVLLAGCSPQPTALPPTPTPAATPTLAPGTVLPAPTAVAMLGTKEWHYVAFGDSQAWLFPRFYAKYIEADLGVKVQVIERSRSGERSVDLLNRLRTDQSVRDEVREAEIITYEASPAAYGSLTCMWGGAPDCSAESAPGYVADLDAIAKEILALRKGLPTVIRAQNFYSPFFKSWNKRGAYLECRRCWDALNESVLRAAAQNNVPVADVYSALNGPNHDADPLDKDYLSSDGIHTNDEGAKAIADAFRKLGYAFIVP